MSDLKLKPCPFCGGEAFLNVIPPHKHHFVNFPDYPGGATVECKGCAVGMMMRTVAEVTEAWNRRVLTLDEVKTMIDRERVIKGLERCLKNDHKTCDYKSEDKGITATPCTTFLMRDALALLKADRESLEHESEGGQHDAD